jgi:hypothetical protein
MFIEKTSKNDAGLPLLNIHQDVVADLRKQHAEVGRGPWWSRLFITLSNSTAEERRAVRHNGLSLKPQDEKPYVIRTSDLHHIAAALKIVDGETVTNYDDTAPNVELYAEVLEAIWLNNVRKSKQKHRPAPNNIPLGATETSDTVIADSQPAEKPHRSDPEHETPRAGRQLVQGQRRKTAPPNPDTNLDTPMGGVDGEQPRHKDWPELGGDLPSPSGGLAKSPLPARGSVPLVGGRTTGNPHTALSAGQAGPGGHAGETSTERGLGAGPLPAVIVEECQVRVLKPFFMEDMEYLLNYGLR